MSNLLNFYFIKKNLGIQYRWEKNAFTHTDLFGVCNDGWFLIDQHIHHHTMIEKLPQKYIKISGKNSSFKYKIAR